MTGQDRFVAQWKEARSATGVLDLLQVSYARRDRVSHVGNLSLALTLDAPGRLAPPVAAFD